MTTTINTDWTPRDPYDYTPLTREDYTTMCGHAGVEPIEDADFGYMHRHGEADGWSQWDRDMRVSWVLAKGRCAQLEADRRPTPQPIQTASVAPSSICRRCGGPASDGSGYCGEC